MHRRPRQMAIALLALIGLGLSLACGGGGSGGATGTLSVPITDAPFPAHDGCLAAALLTVDGVEAKTGSGFVGVPLVDPDPDGSVTLDLLALRAGLMDSLAIAEVPTGPISEIRLHVVGSVLVFEDGSPDAGFEVPSGDASGLKIRIEPPALVLAGETTKLILDVDVSESFHTLGEGGDPTCDDLKLGESNVIFRPLVRANNEATDAILFGNVSDASGMPVADVEVSAFAAGSDLAMAPDPEATTFSAPDGLEGIAVGDYALLLPAGSHDLYLRAQGQADRTLALADVVVAAGESLEGVDLSLP